MMVVAVGVQWAPPPWPWLKCGRYFGFRVVEFGGPTRRGVYRKRSVGRPAGGGGLRSEIAQTHAPIYRFYALACSRACSN